MTMANINNDKVQEKIETAVEMAKETTDVVVEAAKRGRKKAAATAKKTAAAAKKTAEKMLVQETFIQYAGCEYKESDVISAIYDAFKADGHRVGTIKSLQVYIKPEEKTAYYVINDKFTGSVLLVNTAEA